MIQQIIETSSYAGFKVQTHRLPLDVQVVAVLEPIDHIVGHFYSSSVFNVWRPIDVVSAKFLLAGTRH